MRRSFPWNKKYCYKFSDLWANLSQNRCVRPAHLPQIRSHIKFFVGYDWKWITPENPYGQKVPVKAYAEPERRPWAWWIDSAVRSHTDNENQKAWWKYIFTSERYRPVQDMYQLHPKCATCEDDIDETYLRILPELVWGRLFFCNKCRRKASQSIRAMWQGFEETEDYKERTELERLAELVIIAKALSKEVVVPSAFEKGK